MLCKISISKDYEKPFAGLQARNPGALHFHQIASHRFVHANSVGSYRMSQPQILISYLCTSPVLCNSLNALRV
jgi:hypothetical protein